MDQVPLRFWPRPTRVRVLRPADAYEIRHTMADGLGSACTVIAGDRDPNVMYYITVYNEPIHQAGWSRRTRTLRASSVHLPTR